MCTKLKVSNVYITPGMVLQYKILGSVKSGKFGLGGGSYPNIRSEKLQTTWKGFFSKRAIIEADLFIERGVSFGKVDKPVNIACLYDFADDVGIITVPSMSEVAIFHDRMPAIVEDVNSWLEIGDLKLADSDIQRLLI